jgi:hypothetical protein
MFRGDPSQPESKEASAALYIYNYIIDYVYIYICIYIYTYIYTQIYTHSFMMLSLCQSTVRPQSFLIMLSDIWIHNDTFLAP